MKSLKTLLAIGLTVANISSAFANSDSEKVGDLSTASFKGATSCIVYLAEAQKDNFGIVCDGKAIWMTSAPSRKVIGRDGFEAIKKVYTDFMVKKCVEANLTEFKTIHDSNFWGVICSQE